LQQRCRDGRLIWTEVLSTPERDGQGGIAGYHGITRDITERKQAAKLEQKLLHAQKLESLGVLAGGIAHDFNNILMAILGNAELAMMCLGEESPVLEHLNRIEQAGTRASHLTKRMLAYSGKGRFVIENLDLNGLLERMRNMLELTASKKAALRLNLQQSLPSVEADASRLQQVVMNLVTNAAEALDDENGLITIATGCLECDRNYLSDVWLDENAGEGLYVYLEVADTGCGMDQKTVAKLSDPFFTTKFTGRGLGMAAVQGIVKGHRGSVKVLSEPGQGTTVTILLPAIGTSADRPGPVDLGNGHRDAWRGSGTVLLVDDEETVRGIGTAMLRALGFTPITANDGVEAIGIFKQTPDIALVILDLTMPRMDGEKCFLRTEAAGSPGQGGHVQRLQRAGGDRQVHRRGAFRLYPEALQAAGAQGRDHDGGIDVMV
jgi:signal transduction histidine kinase